MDVISANRVPSYLPYLPIISSLLINFDNNSSALTSLIILCYINLNIASARTPFDINIRSLFQRKQVKKSDTME